MATKQPSDECITPETTATEDTQQPDPNCTINNVIGIKRIHDIIQIKGYLTNQLKAEHLEKLVQNVKHKILMLMIVDGDNKRHHARVCVACDCLIIEMDKVEVVEKQHNKFIQTVCVIP